MTWSKQARDAAIASRRAKAKGRAQRSDTVKQAAQIVRSNQSNRTAQLSRASQRAQDRVAAASKVAGLKKPGHVATRLDRARKAEHKYRESMKADYQRKFQAMQDRGTARKGKR